MIRKSFYTFSLAAALGAASLLAAPTDADAKAKRGGISTECRYQNAPGQGYNLTLQGKITDKDGILQGIRLNRNGKVEDGIDTFIIFLVNGPFKERKLDPKKQQTRIGLNNLKVNRVKPGEPNLNEGVAYRIVQRDQSGRIVDECLPSDPSVAGQAFNFFVLPPLGAK